MCMHAPGAHNIEIHDLPVYRHASASWAGSQTTLNDDLRTRTMCIRTRCSKWHHVAYSLVC